MKELEIALELLLKKYKRVLLQEFVVGREFTCGVMNIKRKVVALPITEIVLNKSEVFDYNAKYSIGGCLEITPAKIDKKISTRMQNIAKKVHKIVGCKDVTRTDMILDKNGKLYVLEINTIPGMTKGSLVPQQLTCAGITIPEFIDIMVENNIK